MIFEVLNTIDALLRDATQGVDARIEQVNLAKGTAAPRIQEILVWDLKKLPSEMTMPTIQLVWERSFDLQDRSQLKWKGKHGISINYWTDEKEAEQARKDVVITAHALRFISDDIDSYLGSTIDSVTDRQFSVAGWPLAGRLLTFMNFSFICHERDENP